MAPVGATVSHVEVLQGDSLADVVFVTVYNR
jgi:hypothetical protein